MKNIWCAGMVPLTTPGGVCPPSQRLGCLGGALQSKLEVKLMKKIDKNPFHLYFFWFLIEKIVVQRCGGA